MQNPTPGLGIAQDRRYVPKSAAPNIKGHEPLPRRRNALVRAWSLCHNRGYNSKSFFLSYRRAICATRRRQNANSKDPILSVYNVCAVTRDATILQEGKNERISRGTPSFSTCCGKIITKISEPRSQYVRELEERVRRTESLLKAAGLLDEKNAQDELVVGEEDQPDSDSERDNGRENGNSKTADWGAITDNQPRRHLLTGRKSGSTTGNLDRSSCPPLGPKRPSTNCERRHSATGCSDLQHVPVLRADDREESRYYGLSSTLAVLTMLVTDWL